MHFAFTAVSRITLDIIPRLAGLTASAREGKPMQLQQSWRERFRQELAHAEEARASGNEGRARVCARRAAGIVAAEFIRRRGGQPPASAYGLLRHLQALPGVSAQVQETAGHFLVRVTTEHNLPMAADLVAEAGWLAEELLGESG